MVDGAMQQRARFATFVLAVCGAAACLALLFVVISEPQLIEKKLQSFAIAEVEARAAEAVDQFQQGAIDSNNDLLQSLSNRFVDNAEILTEERDAVIRKIVEDVAAESCGEGCGEFAISDALKAMSLQQRISDMKVGETTLGEFIANRYDATIAGFLGDLKIFGAVNLVAFLTLIFLSIFRGQFGRRILPMTLFLVMYVLCASYWYIFAQDWTSAILFNDWAAGGYLASMVVVYFLLIDFTFAYGMMTQIIFAAIATALSALG